MASLALARWAELVGSWKLAVHTRPISFEIPLLKSSATLMPGRLIVVPDARAPHQLFRRESAMVSWLRFALGPNNGRWNQRGYRRATGARGVRLHPLQAYHVGRFRSTFDGEN